MRRPTLGATLVCAVLAFGIGAAAVPACGENGDNGARDGGGPDSQAPVSFSYDMLLEACVRLGACGVQRHPRLGDCVSNFYKRLVENGEQKIYEYMYHCANQGQGGCKTIRECLGFAARPTDPKLKCDSSYQSRCVGDVAYTCDLIPGGWEQKVDCSKGGLKCGVKDSGSGTKQAICGGGTCDTSTYKSLCVDKKLYKCVGSAIEINDCPTQELQCRDDLAAVCEGTGRSCKTQSDLCKGNILTRCKNDYTSNIDCTKQPGKKTCDSVTNTCKGSGKECSEDSTFDYCETDGNNLMVCIDGYKTKFDCKKMGFLGCEKATTYGAYCRAEPVYD